ncbi:hypothetical protein PROFUN_17060, partial [Planoprotostelium fungivorum]
HALSRPRGHLPHTSLLPVQNITTLYRHLSMLCTVLMRITVLDNKYKLSHKSARASGLAGLFCGNFLLR